MRCVPIQGHTWVCTHTHADLQTHTDIDAHSSHQCACAKDTLLFPGLPTKNLGINRNLISFFLCSSCYISSLPISQNPRKKREGMAPTAFALGVLRASPLAQRRAPATLQTQLEWQEVSRTGQKRSREGPQPTLRHSPPQHPCSPAHL